MLNLREKYVNRFDELIAEGSQIRSSLNFLYDPIEDLPDDVPPLACQTLAVEEYVSWCLQCTTLLERVLPKQSTHRKLILQDFLDGQIDEAEYHESPDFIDVKISKLKAIKKDFEQGFLDDFEMRIAASISASYMEQARELFTEGKADHDGHVPAAVLAGAVLEHNLRKLCERHDPPLPLKDGKGSPFAMDRLITELRKAKVFPPKVEDQLKNYAKTRNEAAHGKFDEFTSDEVDLMLIGVKNFLNKYCGESLK